MAWRSKGVLFVLFVLRLVWLQKELKQRLGASVSECYLPYSDFSGTTPAPYISPPQPNLYLCLCDGHEEVMTQEKGEGEARERPSSAPA